LVQVTRTISRLDNYVGYGDILSSKAIIIPIQAHYRRWRMVEYASSVGVVAMSSVLIAAARMQTHVRPQVPDVAAVRPAFLLTATGVAVVALRGRIADEASSTFWADANFLQRGMYFDRLMNMIWNNALVSTLSVLLSFSRLIWDAIPGRHCMRK
jgi:hypothetical protein